jgi:membrane protease subunit HflK
MAARLIEEANGYQSEVVQRAQGDAQRFNQVLVEYQKAPAVTRERLYLDMMQSVLGNSSKILVDQKSPSLLYLPLDRLIQQSAPPGATTETPAAPPRATPPPDASMSIDTSRSREALRSREGR